MCGVVTAHLRRLKAAAEVWRSVGPGEAVVCGSFLRIGGGPGEVQTVTSILPCKLAPWVVGITPCLSTALNDRTPR